ncbi:MAG: hypothetical protein A3J09_02610 [Candidatus Zambryskibacteria bacterium RIFCSPLOWO2_02_FULL_51_21]|uniref:Cardiolipin synthase N-terminal domain-containing protein n=1 Tax=Candidatus Zambryskibacteria bacterium RIFCSPHIGHO2_02_FULL_43_37 TaxID=1802749 RepID=A0A1G2TGH4_9BACT|nr:MAG: hypothetical protein A2723_02600 [Candidatus Zambryskibacteria bacterium RIFCSPHIGHO2_01_FULL_52_18]OHA96323.1 MAG: hypothetical protein A3D49_00290 [Candidatus Zambryskibacteria bacterium RIFCSPHIGHO2_02_FULL_43_37]OHB07726.1 MAG: hypothetical protein A2944_00165 [Candidatus Zambryskibacteria bacterium RIFCSPLOWO2_01_FULL_52_12]OHB11418.1 MAG: hypothetical protein A3J09_02610 [Candidatus Zambryskibacteria bacterium RIFCSPLOWO2_02_FULL_51_21]
MIKAIFAVAWIKVLVGVLGLILFIWALVDILRSRKTAGMKILWVLICLIFPFLGVVIYLLFGRKENGYIE